MQKCQNDKGVQQAFTRMSGGGDSKAAPAPAAAPKKP